jgi:hypothetical protein
MKQIVMALTATLMMATAASAQDNKQQRPERRMDPSEMIQKRTDNTVKTYGLNEDQAKKLLELNKKYADKMGPRMGGPRGGRRGGPGMRPDGQTGASPRGGNGEGRRPELTEEQRKQMEARRQEMNETMKQYDAELKTIMTEDQYKAYQADRQKRMQEGFRGHRPNRD